MYQLVTNNLKKQSIKVKFILKSSCSQRFLKTHSKGLLKFYKTDVLKDHSKAALIKINSSIKIIIRLLCQKRYYQNYFLSKDIIKITLLKRNYQNYSTKKALSKPLP